MRGGQVGRERDAHARARGRPDGGLEERPGETRRRRATGMESEPGGLIVPSFLLTDGTTTKPHDASSSVVVTGGRSVGAGAEQMRIHACSLRPSESRAVAEPAETHARRRPIGGGPP